MPVIESDRLAPRLDGLEHRLEAIERRLLALEGRATAAVAFVPDAGTSGVDTGEPRIDGVAVLTLIGRTCVILAGAYLLRALTESGSVPAMAGFGVGLAYACAWSVVADRVARRNPLSAIFYGACTGLIGMPLVWEAASRFTLIGPVAAAVMLAGVTGLVLAIAWHRRLSALAWIATLGALAAATALLVTTGAVVPFAAFLVALGIGTLWLGYDRDCTGPRWPAALAADAVVLGLAARALTSPPRDAPAVVLTLQVGLLAAYLGSIAIRTLVRGRDVVPFEVVQTGAMLAAALGGATLVAEQTGTAQHGLGTALLVMAAILYAVAFAFIDRRQGRRVNFNFYTSLALVFMLTGSELVLKGDRLGLVWAAVAILAGFAARRYGRTALAVHSAAYIAAAAAATGLLTASLAALFGPGPPWPSLHAPACAALAALGLVAVMIVPPQNEDGGLAPRLPAWTLAAFTAVIAGGACTVAAVNALGVANLATTSGVVATVRTGVIAGAAVTIAWFGRRTGARTFAYLPYLVLAWGAAKLLLEDLPSSPPALLFVALALYGAALILAPRLTKPSRVSRG